MRAAFWNRSTHHREKVSRAAAARRNLRCACVSFILRVAKKSVFHAQRHLGLEAGCYSGDHTELDLFRLRRGGLGVLLPLAPADQGPPDSFLRNWSVI